MKEVILASTGGFPAEKAGRYLLRIVASHGCTALTVSAAMNIMSNSGTISPRISVWDGRCLDAEGGVTTGYKGTEWGQP